MRSSRTAPPDHDAAPVRRSYNERLILSLIRRRRELPKADLARLTGLSATAVGTIIRQLEADALVTRGAPQKGRVGQPSVPYSLDPRGAYSLGLKIGRRSAELVLIDAAMKTLDIAETIYAYPAPEAIGEFARLEVGRMLRTPERRRRLAGFGVAMPSEIWCWSDEMLAPPGALDAWRDFDLTAAFGARFEAPVFVTNDATAACAAQLSLDPPNAGDSDAGESVDFVYFFVGWFIGGGVVLDGRVFEGRHGNAGAFGSMPVCAGRCGPEQLIRSASLFCLERDLRARGRESETLWAAEPDWSGLGDALERWLDQASSGVAQAISAAASVIDFDAAVIDGSFPIDVRARFTALVREKFARLDQQGLSPLEVRQGGIGRNARAIGAACLPLLSAFAVDEASVWRRGEPAETAVVDV